MVGTPSWKWVRGEISSDEGSAVVWKKIVREEFKLILTFRKEDENIKLCLIDQRYLQHKVHFTLVLS